MKKKNLQELTRRMKEAIDVSRSDPEAGHAMADGVLRKIVAEAHPELALMWDQVNKWYA